MHFQENQLIQNVFFCGLIFLVFVFLRFLCKFSIISELSFMQWSLYCTILHYTTLHFFQFLKKHRFCIHFFSWGLSDPKWPRNNKNNRFLKTKFHDPRETQKFCFLATCLTALFPCTLFWLKCKGSSKSIWKQKQTFERYLKNRWYLDKRNAFL